ncbi:NAD(P)/FAD-dependent oxidoreductase [Aquimixticola soesokkakensis]|uniref:NAD(P)/FAD-dependent oxidoreductase n=1 Tax=Aquimixticola soesokkakensis TaxID=1519096 RepID=UPI001F341494|nr:FAD-dependent oxidoreductase [Aquimixticola soesokkakensis]
MTGSQSGPLSGAGRGRPRIAIVGAGISGLASAYELSATHDVTLLEAAPRLGGHARTVLAGKRGDVPVDTGFIVFNYPNYPNLTRMFDALDVPVKESNMSFAASIGGGALEYGLGNLPAMVAQKRNLLRPSFYRLARDILRFNKGAEAAAQDASLSLGEMLDAMGLGDWFRRYYLLPVSGAIWSSTPEQMNDFPAASLVQFFRNHALLSYDNHQWHTVDGGSIEYVTRIAAAIGAAGGVIRTGTPVEGVLRDAQGVRIRMKGDWEAFDEVIFACHSDDALRLLGDASAAEEHTLGRLTYQDNRAVLHCDARLMPKRKKVWSSWNFLSPEDQPMPAIALTYWMNMLQGIDESDPLFLSLNPCLPIRDETIFDEASFRHPVFDRAAIEAQRDLPDIQGVNRTWFCGAYARWGFHEDGYASAMTVVQALRSRAANAVLEAAE